MPTPLLVLILVVDSVAVVVVAGVAFLAPVETSDLVRFAMLIGCAWAAIEVTRHIERARSFAHQAHTAHIDTSTVWYFAAVIVLPPALASATVVITCFLMWYRVKRRQAVPYRRVYSGCTILLGTQIAILILAAGMHTYPGLPTGTLPAGLADLGVIALAATVSWAVNLGLVLAALAVANPTAPTANLFGNSGEYVLEAGASALALMVAAVLITQPIVLPAVVVVLIALHRGLLVGQYEHAARIDTKTGLAAAGRWHEFATEMLARARHHQTTLGLLIVDLDHFKTINDTHGHPFGDTVLGATADELRSEVRELDACGRWGGEEFTIVLTDIRTSQDLHRIADRIRRRIESVVLEAPDPTHESVTISASVGGVLYTPDNTTTLDDLILAADTALYAAKNAGRNTVRLTARGGSQPDTEDSSSDTPNSPDAVGGEEADSARKEDPE